jgi:hypothetical protein
LNCSADDDDDDDDDDDHKVLHTELLPVTL